MKGILLISHGRLAEGMKETLTFFSGELEQIDSLSLESEQDMKEFSELMKEKINRLDSGYGVVIFCDLAFGTPANVAAQLLNSEQYKNRVQIFTGMNLPMVLEYSQLRATNPSYSQVVEIGQNGIIDLNEQVKNRQKQ